MTRKDHSTSRFGQVFRTFRITLLLCVLSTITAGADGNTPIVITSSDTTGSIWTANAIDKVNRTGKFEQAALAGYVLNAFVVNPYAPASDVLGVLNAAQATYSAQQRLAQSASNYQFAPTEFDALNSCSPSSVQYREPVPIRLLQKRRCHGPTATPMPLLAQKPRSSRRQNCSIRTPGLRHIKQIHGVRFTNLRGLTPKPHRSLTRSSERTCMQQPRTPLPQS